MNDCIRCDNRVNKLTIEGVTYTNYDGGVDALFVVEHAGMLKRNHQYKVKYGVICDKCFNKIKDRINTHKELTIVKVEEPEDMGDASY